MRNCNSKMEYLLFKERYSEYLDTYFYKICKTIKLTNHQIQMLESNTQTLELWKNITHTDYTCDFDTAKCILVLSHQNVEHSLVFFNGYKYAKYIAYL